MSLRYFSVLMIVGSITLTSCNRKGCTDPNAVNYDPNAKKNDGSCVVDDTPSYFTPSTYVFTDANGNNTVSYQGQIERLNQLSEITALMTSGNFGPVAAQDLKDMFENANGNGNGNFSFSSTKQLKDKCFPADVALFESWMDDFALASQSHAQSASNGQAGTLTTLTGSTYLFDANGKEHKQFIEKGLMGAVFMHQALNVYFGAGKMDVDNSIPVDPSNGQYYTTMEHHFDEAFGYFGVDIDFPTNIPNSFWGKYCNNEDPVINSNSDMMNNFLKGRAAISGKALTDRDAAIQALRTEWEDISAYTAISYIDDCLASFGSDQARFLHALAEGYAFAWDLRYAPTETRRMTIAEHDALMALFPDNFWNITIVDLNNIKNALEAKY